MNQPNVAIDTGNFMLISDVHADIRGLDRVLQDAARRCLPIQYKAFLGDALGDGDYPVQVVERIAAECNIAIRGNHDALGVGYITDENFSRKSRAHEHAHRLSVSQFAAVCSYVTHWQRANYLFFHGTPSNCNEYIFNEQNVRSVMDKYPGFDFMAAGHLHIPRLAAMDKRSGEITFSAIDSIFSRHVLDFTTHRYLINCPSASRNRMSIKSPGYCALFHRSRYSKILNFYFAENG